jgi:chromosome segregation protein
VLTEVEQLERDGAAVPDTRALSVDEGIDDGGDDGVSDPDVTDSAEPEAPHAITAEDAIAGLRAKIDRLGPVNMMAIEQFDELETRHTFLTTQRKDLIDSIAATNEAIQRIDETSKIRFRDAFEAINRYFQETFSTLFGGGTPASRSSTNSTRLKAASTSSPALRASAFRACSCCRAARRR